MFVKNKHIQNVGTGMIVIGGVSLAQNFIPGIEGITEADINGIESDITVGEIEMGEANEIGEITVGDTVLEGADYSLD